MGSNSVWIVRKSLHQRVAGAFCSLCPPRFLSSTRRARRSSVQRSLLFSQCFFHFGMNIEIRITFGTLRRDGVLPPSNQFPHSSDAL